jgi:alkanesulfonate monooxygenase SsuD/methylene tetrahydromethanopterin reductase-like flavin-dependent oxidoreductase (luciferase family)
VTGQHYQVTDALCEPKPLQERLPLLVGGKGDRMLGLVARHADEWNMWGLPETLAERAAVLDRHCEKQDRDPATIRRSTQAFIRITDDAGEARDFVASVPGRPAVAGPVDRFAEAVQGWRDVGIDEVIVPDLALGDSAQRLEALDAIIEQVAPHFR